MFIAPLALALVTTTPVTQDRDHAMYNWQARHEQILVRNRQIKPEVVMLGDSITHYWGGEPAAPLAIAPSAWSNCFEGVTVENMGFGWDRTENVLWRIQHGELDEIQPRLIIIKIGTNNIGINSPEDIASGIATICLAVHEKQPTAKILLLGILPRTDQPPGPPATDAVNQLLATRMPPMPYVTFLDLGSAFRDAEGAPLKELYRDGVHINQAGYEILGDHIRTAMLSLLAEDEP